MKVKSILTRARSGTPHTFWLFDLDMQHAKPSIGMCRHLSILPVCSDWLYRSGEVFFSNDITTSELRRLTGSLSQCGLRDLTTSTGCSRVWGYTRRPRSASSQARQVRRGRRTRQEWGETPLEIFYIYIIFIYIYSSFYHNWMRRVLVEEPTQGFLYIICMDISRSEY